MDSLSDKLHASSYRLSKIQLPSALFASHAASANLAPDDASSPRPPPTPAKDPRYLRSTDSLPMIHNVDQDDHLAHGASGSGMSSINAASLKKRFGLPKHFMRRSPSKGYSGSASGHGDDGLSERDSYEGDASISLPEKTEHLIHVDEHMTGLPPSWAAQLHQLGYSEEQVMAMRQRKSSIGSSIRVPTSSTPPLSTSSSSIADSLPRFSLQVPALEVPSTDDGNSWSAGVLSALDSKEERRPDPSRSSSLADPSPPQAPLPRNPPRSASLGAEPILRAETPRAATPRAPTPTRPQPPPPQPEPQPEVQQQPRLHPQQPSRPTPQQPAEQPKVPSATRHIVAPASLFSQVEVDSAPPPPPPKDRPSPSSSPGPSTLSPAPFPLRSHSPSPSSPIEPPRRTSSPLSPYSSRPSVASYSSSSASLRSQAVTGSIHSSTVSLPRSALPQPETDPRRDPPVDLPDTPNHIGDLPAVPKGFAAAQDQFLAAHAARHTSLPLVDSDDDAGLPYDGLVNDGSPAPSPARPTSISVHSTLRAPSTTSPTTISQPLSAFLAPQPASPTKSNPTSPSIEFSQPLGQRFSWGFDKFGLRPQSYVSSPGSDHFSALEQWMRDDFGVSSVPPSPAEHGERGGSFGSEEYDESEEGYDDDDVGETTIVTRAEVRPIGLGIGIPMVAPLNVHTRASPPPAPIDVTGAEEKDDVHPPRGASPSPPPPAPVPKDPLRSPLFGDAPRSLMLADAPRRSSIDPPRSPLLGSGGMSRPSTADPPRSPRSPLLGDAPRRSSTDPPKSPLLSPYTPMQGSWMNAESQRASAWLDELDSAVEEELHPDIRHLALHLLSANPTVLFPPAARILIGEGLSGNVYRATPSLRRAPPPLVLKHVRPSPDSTRFEHLAQELALLHKARRHPNILPIEAAFADAGSDSSDGPGVWLAMPLMDRSLTDVVGLWEAGLRLDGPQMARVVGDVLEALDFLARQLVVHRDIRSDTIMISPSGVCQLADFAHAVRLGPGRPSATGAAGAAYWLAPEIIRGEPYGLEADVWSLGATIFEMLTGQPPYAELEETHDAASISQHLMSGLPPLPPGVDPRAAAFLARCADLEPGERPHPAELAKDPFIVDEIASHEEIVEMCRAAQELEASFV